MTTSSRHDIDLHDAPGFDSPLLERDLAPPPWLKVGEVEDFLAVLEATQKVSDERATCYCSDSNKKQLTAKQAHKQR